MVWIAINHVTDLCYAKSNFVVINTEDTFLDRHLSQKVPGELDEICKLGDEFSFFCKKSNFLKFHLQFNMSLCTWDRNLLSYVKSAMTTWLQFHISFLSWHCMLSLWQQIFIKKSGRACWTSMVGARWTVSLTILYGFKDWVILNRFKFNSKLLVHC